MVTVTGGGGYRLCCRERDSIRLQSSLELTSQIVAVLQDMLDNEEDSKGIGEILLVSRTAYVRV